MDSDSDKENINPNPQLNPIPELPEEEEQVQFPPPFDGNFVEIQGPWGTEQDWDGNPVIQLESLASQQNTATFEYHHYPLGQDPLFYPIHGTYEYKDDYVFEVQDFFFAPSKQQFTFISSIAIKPIEYICSYWIALISKHLAEKVISDILEHLNKFNELPTDNQRRLKLINFITKFEKKIAKEIRSNWQPYNLKLIQILVVNDYIV